MKLLETYDKNKKKHQLDEVTAATAAGTFTGRGGQLIDTLFAGGFHPISGSLEKLLQKQIDDNIIKRMYTDDVTPASEVDWLEVDWEYKYTPHLKVDNSKFKSTSETEMQVVGDIINYDKIIDNREENKKYINDTSDWKSIYDNKKY